jgi:nucleotidyltransferase/DNA polymerase involved in DNA repair
MLLKEHSTMQDKKSALKELSQIPGVGKVVSRDLYNLGFKSIKDLKGINPEKIYDSHNKFRGSIQDRCMLYTFRCAVYYANTEDEEREKQKLNWWYWKD